MTEEFWVEDRYGTPRDIGTYEGMDRGEFSEFYLQIRDEMYAAEKLGGKI